MAPPATSSVPPGASARTTPDTAPSPSLSASGNSAISVAADARVSGAPAAVATSTGSATRGAFGKVSYASASARSVMSALTGTPFASRRAGTASSYVPSSLVTATREITASFASRASTRAPAIALSSSES